MPPLFWIVAATMTLIATIATVWPLLKTKPITVPVRARHDAQVYRAQLAELEADRERGTIGAEEARVARAEIARRLIRAEAASGSADGKGGLSGGRLSVLAAVLVALAVPPGVFLVYGWEGSPEMGDMPLASREASPAPTDMSAMIAAVERRLAAEPDDATGWSLIAPIYMGLGQPEKAVGAYRNVLRLQAPTAQALAGLGEALVQVAGGEITPEANERFAAALALDPSLPSARFYTALNLSQTGRYAEARGAWTALIAVSPGDAPWLELARSALADADAKLGGGGAEPANAAAPPRGPSAQDVAAAEALPEADRRAMVEGMVSGLAERLREQPGDAEGWKRLMRSYTVLGQPSEAEDAGRRALGVFLPDTAEGRDLLTFARSLGLNLSGDVAPR